MISFPNEAWFQQILDLISPVLADVTKVWNDFVELRPLVAGMQDWYKLKWNVLELLDAKIQFSGNSEPCVKRKRGRPPLDYEDQKIKEQRDK